MVIKELEGDLARVVRILNTSCSASLITDLPVLPRPPSSGHHRGRHDTAEFDQTSHAQEHAFEAT